MKIKFIIGLIFFSNLLFSQGFKGGLFAGMTASQVDGDQWAGYSKVGLQMGVYSRYLFNDSWSLVTELKYIQKGSIHTEKDNPYAYFRIKLNYIEIPVLLNFQLNNRFVFGAGLSYGYLLNAKVDDASGSVPEEQLAYRNLDINALTQVKYLLNERIWIDLKFAYSVIYITDVSPRQFNNLISLGFGYEI